MTEVTLVGPDGPRELPGDVLTSYMHVPGSQVGEGGEEVQEGMYGSGGRPGHVIVSVTTAPPSLSDALLITRVATSRPDESLIVSVTVCDIEVAR